MKLHPFVNALTSLRFDNCFNPYNDRCAVHDMTDAPHRRAEILSTILNKAVEAPVDAIWIGRDLGYRGGRRTGLALTDDPHLDNHARRWGIEIERPTTGPPVTERTASVIWDLLDRIEGRIFLWNVFPLHPHEPHTPFTNRMHNAEERRAGEQLLEYLIALIQPARIVAIGNDAGFSAQRVAPPATPVKKARHPSYGGQSDFIKQIADIHGLAQRQPDLF